MLRASGLRLHRLCIGVGWVEPRCCASRLRHKHRSDGVIRRHSRGLGAFVSVHRAVHRVRLELSGGRQASTVAASIGGPLLGLYDALFRFGTVQAGYVYRRKTPVHAEAFSFLPYTAVHGVHRFLIQHVAGNLETYTSVRSAVHHDGGNGRLYLRVRGNLFLEHVLRFFSSRIRRCTAGRRLQT